jgi:BirA family biotin operon repressor/biotin-[acetyl-CoA-carboxylase] ligase
MSGDESSELRLPPAYRLVTLDSVVSSNEEAKRLAAEGAEDGTLVWAREQTGGKGRQGRQWASPRGNLYLSLILRPDCPLKQASQLGFVAALALGDAVGSVAPPLIEVTYKWPNDVLANGRKLAGILLEAQATPEGGVDWLVLGLGANVKSFPKDSEMPATGLHFEGCAPSVTEAELLQAFARHFLAWVNIWLEEGFEPIRKTWLRHAEGKGDRIRVRLPRETLEGRFLDLDGEGHLLLDLGEASPRAIAVGDVFFDRKEA